MIAVIQLSSTHNKVENLNTITSLLEQASKQGAVVAFLPEGADFIARSQEETRELAESIDGPFMKTIKSLAIRLNLWISVGSVHRTPELECGDQRLFNTHTVISHEGHVEGLYDKTHLFGIDLSHHSKFVVDKKTVTVQESLYVQPGNSAPVIVRGTPVGDLGLAICFDLRFPELASSLRHKGGANVLCYPSAFRLETGQAGHWHTLLRARAIETQSYVVAAAQEGFHHKKLTTYGHSLVVDPWGQIIAERTESGPGLLLVKIQHDSVSGGVDNVVPISLTNHVRSILPVTSSRRFDLFPLVDSGSPLPIGPDEKMFGPHKLKSSVIFYQTFVSMAFVNISPLVPGHILVTPISCIKRFNDLPPGTIADLFLTVNRISPKLAEHFGAPGLCISIQDGEAAGQSVPHVHIHVLPRKPGDFAHNDDIYTALQTHDKVANRKFRSIEEMEEEAKLFRSFFYSDDGLPLK